MLLLLTFNNQEKSLYVPKSMDNFSPLMLPLAVCQSRAVDVSVGKNLNRIA